VTVRRTLGLSAVLLLSVTASVPAQETRIRVVQPGAKHLMSDLKDIVALTPNKGLQKEWKNLEETLDGFLMGIDRDKPIRVDFTIGSDASGNPAISYLPSFPIQKFEGKKGDSFLENVDSVGYKAKKKLPQTDLYELTQPGVKGAKPMYLRYVHGYAVIGEKEKDVPPNLPNPVADVQHLLKLGYDVAAEMKNDAAGAGKRKAEFEGLRKQLEAAIKFKRNEDKAEFELRKLGTTQMFEEAERFIVEAELLRVGWTTQPGATSGQGHLSLTALPQTSLLDSIRLLATKVSYFANVSLHPNPVLSGKILFPLDDFRKAQAKVRHPVFRAATKAGIDKREKLTDDGKAAAKEAIDKLVDIFDASLDIGFDGFVDMYESGEGKHTAVAGMRAEQAKLADDIVALLPKIRDDWQVKLNAFEHGGVAIHEIAIPKRRHAEFGALFAGEPVLYVGTSEQAVWGACGQGALDELKKAIDRQAQPAPEMPDANFFTGTMKFGPFIRLLDVIRANQPKDNAQKSKQEIQQEKERDRLRQLALEAFAAGDDVLTGRLYRDGDEVKGEMSITEGIYRFFGSAIADFSKTNLR
jgi:hypothetical protein